MSPLRTWWRPFCRASLHPRVLQPTLRSLPLYRYVASSSTAYEVVYGYHPVKLALQLGSREAKHVYLLKSSDRGQDADDITEIIDMANEKNLRLSYLSKQDMNILLPGKVHQGIALKASSLRVELAPTAPGKAANALYWWADVVTPLLQSGGRRPVVLAVDEVWDPHNLGALVRSAAALVSGSLWAVLSDGWLGLSGFVWGLLFSLALLWLVPRCAGLCVRRREHKELSTALPGCTLDVL